jgi:hypothetical protein
LVNIYGYIITNYGIVTSTTLEFLTLHFTYFKGSKLALKKKDPNSIMVICVAIRDFGGFRLRAPRLYICFNNT